MIDAPEFDPHLNGHSAAVIKGLCHAEVSDLLDGEYRSDITECGLDLREEHLSGRGPRKDFEGVEMCPDCWPDSVVDASG